MTKSLYNCRSDGLHESSLFFSSNSRSTYNKQKLDIQDNWKNIILNNNTCLVIKMKQWFIHFLTLPQLVDVKTWVLNL